MPSIDEATFTVPASVPSLFHNSTACVNRSTTVKNTVSPTPAVSDTTNCPFGWLAKSLTITVEDSVPSLFHSTVRV